MKSRNISYLPALDHLRAYAVAIVILYHGLHVISPELFVGFVRTAASWPRASNPFAAVLIEAHTTITLLFVLSGFIFTFGTYGTDVSYWRFMRNRALRIYPLYLILFVVGIYAYPEKFDFSYIGQTIFTLSNVQRGTLFAPFTAMFWTIQVDMQCYLLFPFLLSILNRRGVGYLLGIIAVAITMRFFAMLAGANIRDLNHFTIVGRIDQFLIGMVVAVIYRKYFKPDKLWDAGFVLATLVLGVCLWWLNQHGGWRAAFDSRFLWPTLEGLIWAPIVLGYFSLARFIPAMMSRVLTALGTISYSPYLLHFVFLTLAVKMKLFHPIIGLSPHQTATVETLVFLLPPILLVSVLTYHFIEKPFLEMRGSYKVGREGGSDITPANLHAES